MATETTPTSERQATGIDSGSMAAGIDSTFWRVEAAAGEDRPASLFVYGEIGEMDDVQSRSFVGAIRAQAGKRLAVYVNSPGGEVFAAQAIYSQLRRHDGGVTVYVDGLAASAASVIAMAGDEVIMAAGSLMMIHNPSGRIWGESRDMRKGAETLDAMRESMVSAYERKTGMDRARIVEMLDEETWLSAETAVELGFADRVEGERVTATMRGTLAVFNGLTVDTTKYSRFPALALTPERAPTNAAAAATMTSGETDLSDKNVDVVTLQAKALAASERADKAAAELTEARAQIATLTNERDAVKAALETERTERLGADADRWIASLASEGRIDAEGGLARHLRGLYVSGQSELASTLANELTGRTALPFSTPQRTRATAKPASAEPKRWTPPKYTVKPEDARADMTNWPSAVRAKVEAMTSLSPLGTNPVAAVMSLRMTGELDRLLTADGYAPVGKEAQ